MTRTSPDTLEGLLRRLEAAQRRLADLFARLAGGPPRPELESNLDRLLQERDTAARDLGLAALSWRLAGGSLRFLPSAETDDAIILLQDPVETPGPDDSVDSSLEMLDAQWTPEANFDASAVLGIATRLGPPLPDLDDDARISEAAALDRELLRIETWSDHPRPVQRALLGLFVARLRALQDDSPPQVRALLDRQLRKGFAKLTQFSSTHQPGYVTGLGRNHQPDTGSWQQDADFWWKSLGRELGGFSLDAEQAALDPEAGLARVRAVARAARPDVDDLVTAVREALEVGVSPEDGRLQALLAPHLEALGQNREDSPLVRALQSARDAGPTTAPLPIDGLDELPEDWPFAQRLRGRLAAVVGGPPKGDQAAHWAEIFGFKGLRWVEAARADDVTALTADVQDRAVDLVIVLARHLNESTTDELLPACRHARVDWIMVRQGEHLHALRGALERYLADQTATVPVAPADPS